MIVRIEEGEKKIMDIKRSRGIEREIQMCNQIKKKCISNVKI